MSTLFSLEKLVYHIEKGSTALVVVESREKQEKQKEGDEMVECNWMDE